MIPQIKIAVKFCVLTSRFDTNAVLWYKAKEETQEKKTTSYLDEFENLKKELNAKKENNFDWLKDDKLFTDEHLNDPETTSTKLDSNDDDDDLMNMDF